MPSTHTLKGKPKAIVGAVWAVTSILRASASPHSIELFLNALVIVISVVIICKSLQSPLVLLPKSGHRRQNSFLTPPCPLNVNMPLLFYRCCWQHILRSCLFACIISIADAQANYNLTTLAGAQSANYLGDNGPSTSARLFAPSCVVFDTSTGSFVFADSSNGAVRKVLSNGTIVRIAGQGCYGCSGNSGDGPATSSKLNVPTGLALDGFGGIFVAEKSNQ